MHRKGEIFYAMPQTDKIFRPCRPIIALYRKNGGFSGAARPGFVCLHGRCGLHAQHGKHGEDTMSVKIREAAAARLPVSAWNPARLWPLAGYAAALAAGFFGAGAGMFGNMRPLGLCAVAAAPGLHAPVAAAGAALGYALALPIDAASPYLVAAAVVCLWRVFVHMPDNAAHITAAAAGAVSFCTVRMALALSGGEGLISIALAAAQGMLIVGLGTALGACARCVRTAQNYLHAQRAALCILYMALVVCCAPYTVLGICAAHVVAGFVCLAQAKRHGTQGAALYAAASAVALCAASSSNAPAAVGLAAGSLAAGLLRREARGAGALAFCGAGFLGAVCAALPQDGFSLMAELCLSGAIYTMVPSTWVLAPAPRLLAGAPDSFSAPLAGSTKTEPGAAQRRAAGTVARARIGELADALGEVGRTLQAVCERAPQEKQQDFIAELGERCCAECENACRCWVEFSDDTFDAFSKLEQALAGGAVVTADDIAPPVLARCKAPVRLAGCANAVYALRTGRTGTRAQKSAARRALMEEYGVMASALARIAAQTVQDALPDKPKTRRLSAAFAALGMPPLDVTVFRDAAGRTQASVLLAAAELDEMDLQALTAHAETACRRHFAPATLRRENGLVSLFWAEQPRLCARYGTASLAAQDDVCADAVKTGQTATGGALAVLCDGMGTGKIAAVDGMLAATLAARLLAAGFSGAETARLVNHALALRADGEASATLDAFTADLYSGEATLYKAGAAPSFLVREGRAEVYETQSVPIGILGEVLGKSARLYIGPGDTMVLCSDGALAAGKHFLASVLAANGEQTPQQMAQAAVDAVKEKLRRPDDITVLAIRFEAAGA